MKNRTVSEKLDALVKLQKIDSALDQIKKMRGDLPEEVRNMEDEVEGLKARMERFKNEHEALQEGIEGSKQDMKTAEALIEKYTSQQKNVKNSREYNAITKELELQELEVQICEKNIKESQEKVEQKKEELLTTEKQIAESSKELANKREGLSALLEESKSEENALLEQRKEAVQDVEEKLLKYYNRLRNTLSNGLAVVPVVRGAAQGCNIVIPPQKIAEIREQKKIVIDEHSGRILAYVDMESMKQEEEKKKRTVKRKAPAKQKTASKVTRQ